MVSKMKKNYTQKIVIKKLECADLHKNALNSFNRYQLTTHVKYLKDGTFHCKAERFEENWDQNKKEKIVEYLRKCLEAGGVVIGAFNENKEIIGFASLGHLLFGKNKEYIELSYLHVSNEYRNHGIGRKMFELCCEYAKQKSAKKLYISTHPSAKTQRFYEALGCVPAIEINERIYNHEPFDVQLEYCL